MPAGDTLTPPPIPLERAAVSRLRVLRIDSAPAESLRSRGLMSLVGLVSQSAARFLTNWIAGRVGGPIALGQISVALSSVQLLTLLGPTSAGAAASRYLAAAVGDGDLAASRALARHLWSRAAITGGVLAVAGALIWGVQFGGSLSESANAGFLVLALTGYTLARGTFFGHRHVVVGGWWDLGCALAAVLGVTSMLVAGVHSVLALLPLGVMWLLYTWAGWPRGQCGRLDADRRHEVDRFVVVSALGTVASAGFVQASQVAARVVGGEEGAGHYSAAFTLAVPLSILVGAANQVLFPSMAEAVGRGDDASVHRQLHQATMAVTALAGGAIGALVVASGSVVELVWGERFAAAKELLPVLLFGVLANAVAVPAISAQVVRGVAGNRAMTLFSWCGVGTGVLVWALTAPTWGVDGIAVGFLASGATVAALAVLRARRTEDQHWGGLLLRLAIVAGAAVAGWWWCRERGVLVTTVTTVGFLLVWAVVSAPELRAARAFLRRGAASPPDSVQPHDATDHAGDA